MIWLAGGPSHIDTFDPKPDATPDVRGEFKAIDTAVPGLKISEVFPKLAAVMNKTTLLRAVTSPEADHDRAASFRVRDLTPPDRLTLDRLRRRREMVRSLDGFAKEISDTPLTASRDQFTDQAYGLLTSTAAQAAFNVSTEPTEVRDRYGRTTIGQTCLLARRLVEAGVSFVTINDRGMGQLGWDTHQQNFPTIKNTLAPPIDQGVSTLINDLDERRLLDSTLILMMGEFGRTPKINPNAGRDHHGRANCALLAGGGLPRGVVLGKTDNKGDSPTESPTTPSDLAAIVFTALGIDPDFRFTAPDGRPIRIVENGKVPSALMAHL